MNWFRNLFVNKDLIDLIAENIDEIEALKLKVAELEASQEKIKSQLIFSFNDHINSIVKNEFARISQSYDKLILSESERLRKDYKQFKKEIEKQIKR